MGLIALPEMRRAGYAPSLATGSLAAGGSIGTLTPPSAVLIVFGILSEQSIGKLFTAAIVPAITQALFYMAVIWILCRLNPALGPTVRRTSWAARLRSLRNVLDIAGLVVLVIGGIASGIFSPTEAASIGVIGAALICAWRRKLSYDALRHAVLGAMRTAGMIYLIIICAVLLSVFVSASGFAAYITVLVDLMNGNAFATMLLLVLLLLILGTFLDGMAMLTLVVPIFLPIVLKLGLSPIWFGILVVRTMEVGLITPPIGMNVYVIHSYAKDVPLRTVFRGVLPFYIADMTHIGALLAFPALALFLPRVLGS
jgi:tripartite ATP-independent transporter DctM subunit